MACKLEQKKHGMKYRQIISQGCFISKIDEEHSDFYKVLEQLQEQFGHSVIAYVLPIMENNALAGVVNVATMKAKRFKGDSLVDADIPDDMSDIVEKYREGVMEAIAETDEDLMEKYFSGEAFSEEEILEGLKRN